MCERSWQCYRSKLLGVFESRLLNNFEVGVIFECKGANWSVVEGVLADKFYSGWNGDFLKLRTEESFRLNCNKTFWQCDVLNLAKCKCFATDGNYVAKAKCVEVNNLGRTFILENSHIATCKCCILPIGSFHNVECAKIITFDATIPVFVKILRKSFACKEQFAIFCTQKCVGANVFHTCGNCYSGKIFAVVECVSANTCDCVWNIELCKTIAESKCKVIYISKLCIAEVDTL